MQCNQNNCWMHLNSLVLLIKHRNDFLYDHSQYEYINDKALLQGYRVEHLYEITVLNVQKAGKYMI